jgi:uncharacterized protein (DUF983 family)
MFKLKNFNTFSVLSLLFIVAGIGFYVAWGLKYSVWVDIGVYALTIVLVLSGVIGLLITLSDKE